MKTLITVYVIGVFFAIIHFAMSVKKYCPNRSFLTVIHYVMSDKRQLKFTLKSWFYFFNL